MISLTILLLSAGWIVFSRAEPGATTGGAIPAPRAGFLAPDFELTSASGETLRLSDLRGRPVLLNFWASWCPPCREEMPAFEQAYRQYQDDGFVILAVNAAYSDSPAKALAFSESLDLTFPIVFDYDGSVAGLYRTHSLPSSFFIDAGGVIQDVVIGGMPAALIEVRLQELLEEGS